MGMKFKIETEEECQNCLKKEIYDNYKITIINGKVVCKSCEMPITSNLEIEIEEEWQKQNRIFSIYNSCKKRIMDIWKS